jgi:DNA mismatch repair protein MutL
MFLDKTNERAVTELINDIDEGMGVDDIKDKFAATIACHFSVRAGKNLIEQEITSLIQNLEKCDNPNMCPHGRPTMLKLSLNRIESHFGRT